MQPKKRLKESLLRKKSPELKQRKKLQRKRPLELKLLFVRKRRLLWPTLKWLGLRLNASLLIDLKRELSQRRPQLISNPLVLHCTKWRRQSISTKSNRWKKRLPANKPNGKLQKRKRLQKNKSVSLKKQRPIGSKPFALQQKCRQPMSRSRISQPRNSLQRNSQIN